MHYLSSANLVAISLHVSGLLFANHQQVTMHMCNNWQVLYVLVDCQLASIPTRPADSQLNVQHVPVVAYIHCYLLMMGNYQARNM
jgi:hypothetical protein